MKTPYQDITFESNEQAAGFPPFTRGYFEYAFSPEISSNNELISFNYTLESNSPEAIYKLFQTLLKNNSFQPIFHLLLHIPINSELVVVTKTLRTLFALVNHLKSDNANTSKFHFYVENTDYQSILTAYQYVEMSQVDTLIVSPKDEFLLGNFPETFTPIDPFYNSTVLDKKVETLTSKVWKKIQPYFTQ